MKNPWLGLSSYTEESLNDYQFNGRTTAIAGLTSMIRQNLFVTLYGRSGIGKTSLLQAGVFPVLRRDGFSPLIIRLNDLKDSEKSKDSNIKKDKVSKDVEDKKDKTPSAANLVWNKISESLLEKGFIYTPYNVNDAYNPNDVKNGNDILFFRKLFSAGRFLNDNGTAAIPIIVIDQFEEALFNAPQSSRLLISQLYALIDDNCNICVYHPCWHDDTNFRIVASIREDYLYLFEDNIDSLNCIDFKSNRYRLLPLTDEEAKEVILNPVSNQHIFEEGKENQIAEDIIRLSKGTGQQVNTLLLSLLCYLLYNDITQKNKIITTAEINNYKNILEKYYLEKTKGIKKSQRYYLEDHLIDDQGRRVWIYRSDLQKNAPDTEKLLENTGHRLLNENQGRVEFIHDQLATAVSKIRDQRKSKNTRRIVVIGLVIFLIGIFLYSFSRLTPLKDSDSWKVNDTENISFDIKLDSLNNFYSSINDCPSLKSIEIKGNRGSVEILNCPNLVNVSYPNTFSGQINVFNCPNINKNKYDKIREGSIDSVQENFRSQYPYTYCDLTNPEHFFSYNKKSNTLFVLRYPIAYISNSKILRKVPTFLPDSIKRETDCYVPFGEKDKFSRLVEYQPFRSIRELPLYYTWQANASGMIKSMESYKWQLHFSLMGVILVFCYFIGSAYNKFKINQRNTLSIFTHTVFYAIEMTLLAILAFLAFYWVVFNIILPANQTVSIVTGVLGSLVCTFFIYKNVFFSFNRYIRNNGIRGLGRDLKDNLRSLPSHIRLSYISIRKIFNKGLIYIKKNVKNLIINLIILILAFGTLKYYIDGKHKRQNYLDSLNEIVDSEEYVRAFAIAKELDKQHSCIVYPFFKDSLESICRLIQSKLSSDSIYITHCINPKLVKDIASRQNLTLDFYDFQDILAVSNDASKLAINIRYLKSNDLQEDLRQAILIDLKEPKSIKVLTEKTTAYNYEFKSSFSPSGESLVIKYDKNGDTKKILYSTKQKTPIEINTNFHRNMEDIVMLNDSVYCFTSWGTLYKALAKRDANPVIINESEEIWKNLILMSENLIAGSGNWSEIIIYDTLNDSAYFHSKQRKMGIIKNIDKNYAITSQGLFSIKLDTLINENSELHKYNGKIVELQKHDNEYSFYDLDGKKIAKIPQKDGEKLNITFCKDEKHFINRSFDNIYIYNSFRKMDKSVSDEDKKLFDLK